MSPLHTCGPPTGKSISVSGSCRACVRACVRSSRGGGGVVPACRRVARLGRVLASVVSLVARSCPKEVPAKKPEELSEEFTVVTIIRSNRYFIVLEGQNH